MYCILHTSWPYNLRLLTWADWHLFVREWAFNHWLIQIVFALDKCPFGYLATEKTFWGLLGLWRLHFICLVVRKIRFYSVFKLPILPSCSSCETLAAYPFPCIKYVITHPSSLKKDCIVHGLNLSYKSSYRPLFGFLASSFNNLIEETDLSDFESTISYRLFILLRLYATRRWVEGRELPSFENWRLSS